MDGLLSPINPLSLIGDAVIIVILIISIICGLKKGFLGLIVGFLSGIVTIVVASLLCKPVADLLGNVFGLREPIEGALIKAFGLDGAAFTTPVKDLTKDAVSGILADIKLPSFLLDSLQDKIYAAIDGSSAIGEGVTLGGIISSFAASACLIAISWVALFVILTIVFLILKRFVKLFNKIPVIGMANKILGALLSAIIALACICVAVYLFVLISAFLPQSAIDFVNGSPILGFLYNSNPIGTLLARIFK